MTKLNNSVIRTELATDDTLLDLFNASPHRAPIDSHHPAVRTHPVTNWRALNVNPCFVTGFAELKKKESGRWSEHSYLQPQELTECRHAVGDA